MIRFPNGTVRYLTILEAKRLQTFSDDFVIKGVWGEAMRQLGNAVPIRLAKIMGHELLETINYYKHSITTEGVLNRKVES
jgi:DNA (cytosine-5)-methyltransferase 1